MSDAERKWALAAPYDPKLVAELKRIPGGARAWLPDSKVWLFEREYLDSVRGLCGRLYWTETLCPTCWVGNTCAVLAELAGAEGATLLTSRPPPAASPPRKPSMPTTAGEAAAILKCSAFANPAEVKRRARELAQEAHPDHDGDHDRMVVILAARDLLLALGVQRG